MYDRDMPILRDYGLGSPDGLADVVTFVLLTIQMKFQTVEQQFADVRKRKAKSAYLFGSKRDGYRYVHAEKDRLYAAMQGYVARQDVVGAVDYLTQIPGLGVVKAGFVAQCLGLECGCLDTHNIVRFGLKPNTLKLPKTLSPETRLKKVRAYVDLCKRIGGARYLWNSWCDYIADIRSSLGDGDAVSAFHCRAIGLS